MVTLRQRTLRLLSISATFFTFSFLLIYNEHLNQRLMQTTRYAIGQIGDSPLSPLYKRIGEGWRRLQFGGQSVDEQLSNSGAFIKYPTPEPFPSDFYRCVYPHFSVSQPDFERFRKPYNPFSFSKLHRPCPPFPYKHHLRLDFNGTLSLVIPFNEKDRVKCSYRKVGGYLGPKQNVLKLGDYVNIAAFPFTVAEIEFVVDCFKRNTSALAYRRIFVHVLPHHLGNASTKVVTPKNVTLASNPFRPISIDIYILESLSTNQMRREMPKLYDYFTQGPQWSLFERPLKVGDNTHPNLIALLTGIRSGGGHRYDTMPWIWHKMAAKGCTSIFVDDPLSSSIMGFGYYGNAPWTKWPTDVYIRAAYCYYRHLFPISNTPWPCSEGGDAVEFTHNLFEQWVNVTSEAKRCRFTLFNTLKAIGHDYLTAFQLVDKSLVDMLTRIESAGKLDNSLTFIIGDHGHRLNEAAKQTFIGRMEERTAMFALRMPPRFYEDYPKSAANMHRNTKATVSHFDWHRTFLEMTEKGMDYVELNVATVNNPSNMGAWNLFGDFPVERTCRDMKVPARFCVCLEDITYNMTSPLNYDKITERIHLYLHDNSSEVTIDTSKTQCYAPNNLVRNGVRNGGTEKPLNGIQPNVYHRLSLTIDGIEASAMVQATNKGTIVEVTCLSSNNGDQSIAHTLDRRLVNECNWSDL